MLTFKAKVSKVVDGDTFDTEDVIFDFIDFKISLNKPRYRMLGVNTPERNMKGYKEATSFTRDTLEGKEVSIEITGKDVFGRYLCIVHLEEGTLNQLLLDKKLAIVYER